MKFSVLATAVFGIVLGVWSISAAQADGAIMAGPLKIEGIWSRATPKGARVGAGYMTITNTGDTADMLVAATHPTAGRVEIHTMTMENGVMRMRKLDDGLEIPAGETVTLEPGGFHVMFLELDGAHVEGETVAGTLTFQAAGTVEVSYAIKGIAAGMTHEGHGKMDHGHGAKGHGKTH